MFLYLYLLRSNVVEVAFTLLKTFLSSGVNDSGVEILSRAPGDLYVAPHI